MKHVLPHIVLSVIVAVLVHNERASAQPPPEKTWGICIGIAEYQPQDISLNWANKDAIDFCTSFLRYGLGLPETHYHILKDREATRQNILDRLAWLVGTADAGDRVYIFYSGHGTPASPFLPHDSQQKLSLQEIKRSVQKIYAQDVIVFADACYSGRLAGKGAKAVLDKQNITGLSKAVIDELGAARANVLVMTSAKGIQQAYEQPENKNGLFTYYLMNALMNPQEYQDADSDHNGELTLYEAHQYVYRHVANTSEQQPQISDARAAKTLVLLRRSAIFGHHGELASVALASAPVPNRVPDAGQGGIIDTWVDMVTDKASLIRQEMERLMLKRKTLMIARSVDSDTAEKIHAQIRDLEQNVTDLLQEYGGIFDQVALFDAQLVKNTLEKHARDSAKTDTNHQRSLSQLIQQHFDEYLTDGKQIERWQHDFENLSL